MSLNGLGLGAIHLLYLARDVTLNLNCLTLLRPLLGTYTLGQEGACVYGYVWKAAADVGVFLNCTQPYIFEAWKKNTCSPLILLGWLASEQPGAPSPPPQHWATGVFNCTQLFSWVLVI